MKRILKIVAIVVGAIEAWGLVADKLGFTDKPGYADLAPGHHGGLGYLIVGVFAASWLVSR